MTIYLFSLLPEAYKELTLPDGESFAEHNCLRWAGESKTKNWKAFKLVWLEDELSSENDQDADFLKFSGVSVLTEKAYQVLYDPLKPFVEFLPVYIGEEQRYLLNVINVLDIMQKEKSIYKLYSSGKVGMCEHAFINEPSTENSIYQVNGYLGRTFVNELVVKLIEEHSLTGTLIRQYKNPQLSESS